MFKIKKKLKEMLSSKKTDSNLNTDSRLNYEMLEANQWARYLMPLDYKPSRCYESRYGFTQPVLESIELLFKKNTDTFSNITSKFFDYLPNFKQFLLTFSHKTLPKPGFIGGALNPIDTCSIYTFVAMSNPKKYVEIGSGLSTCVARQAIKDHNLQTKIIAIDPDPRCEINDIVDQNIPKSLEDYDLSLFSSLEKGDIVFMDGSHRSFMNSDVTVFMLEVLPKLKPGVIIQIHDIVLPYDYAPFFKNFYWNEQYMVAMYLMAAADKIKPLFPVNYIHKLCPKLNEELSRLLLDIKSSYPKTPPEHIKNYDNNWVPSGGSLWFTHKS